MKTLLLLRHARASRDDLTLRDFDRPLNDRGERDARLIGQWIKKKKIAVGIAVSSPAKRALHTAEIVLQAAGFTNEITFNERIYEASLHQLLKVVSEIQSSYVSALLVGHNPGFEELLSSLTDRGGHMPTASLWAIELDINNWNDVAPRSGELSWYIAPKQLKS